MGETWVRKETIDPKTEKIITKSELVTYQEEYFDTYLYEAAQRQEEEYRNQRGKGIPVIDDMTFEPLPAHEIKQLEEEREEGLFTGYIMNAAEPLEKIVSGRKKPVKTNRKYKTRIPISKELRIAVYQLHDSACRNCGNKKANQIHHIDGNPANNDIRNLQLLCYDCHLSVEGKQTFRII